MLVVRNGKSLPKQRSSLLLNKVHYHFGSIYADRRFPNIKTLSDCFAPMLLSASDLGARPSVESKTFKKISAGEEIVSLDRTMNGKNSGRKGARLFACAVFLAILFAASRSFAQGTMGPVVVLRTGTGSPLISSLQPVGSFNGSGPASLQFAFGFSTSEELAPGIFLDSFTLTLGDPNDSLYVIFNTTDRSSSYWAPNAPGAIFVPADSITRQIIPFSNLEPNHAHQFAYLVTAPVPNELLGRNLNFYADLFDNQNGIDSLGWVSVASIPEPSTWTLLFTGVVLFFAFQWRSQ
jgi:hypothetical protein